MDAVQKTDRVAIIWCTDGGDHDYWRYTAASFRAFTRCKADFIVLADQKANLHGFERRFGLRRIDPTPQIQELGFNPADYQKLGKRWPFPIFHKLAVPLIDEFRRYRAVVTVDTDVMVMPTPKHTTLEDLFNHPLDGFEVAGVPDLYEPLDRVHTLVEDAIPYPIRKELEARVWSKHGFGCQAYVSAGLFLWNIDEILKDRDWYIRRCKAFWQNLRAYTFPEQDFVNCMMHVDSRLQTAFGARADGNGPYIVADACLRHFTGTGKNLLYNMGKKIPEINPLARFAQANLVPRKSFFNKRASWYEPRKCMVWACSTDDKAVTWLNYSIDSYKKHCSERLNDIDLFVLADGPGLSNKLKRDDVRILDISGLFDVSGIRAVCNWRSGRITWARMKLARIFVPFVPELSKYDLALYLDADTFAVDSHALDVFDTDVCGYDCAMAAEFEHVGGVYKVSSRVRFCKAFLQSLYDVPDSDIILGRLNQGIYFNAGMYLANMPEMRKTLGSLQRVCQWAVRCIGNGAPVVHHDLFNSVCWICRFPGSFNTRQVTHFDGEPVYCVHNAGYKDGKQYPTASRSWYV